MLAYFLLINECPKLVNLERCNACCLRRLLWATSGEINDIQLLGVVCRGGGQPPLPKDCCETNVCFCKCCAKGRGGKKDAIEDDDIEE